MTAERRLIEHYAAVRQRCYGRAPKPVRPIPPQPVPKPIWRLVYSAPKPKAAWEIIIHEVADKHGVSVGWLTGPSKARKIVGARFEAYARLYQEIRVRGNPPPMTWIAAKIGRRDHSCVCYALQKMGLR